MKRLLSLVISFVVAALWLFPASGTDGTLRIAGNNWDSYRLWERGDIARNGGLATFVYGSYRTDFITQNYSEMVLSGMDFTSMALTINKNPITLTGERPFLTGTSEVGPLINSALIGTGANTLVKDGPGTVTLSNPISGFSGIDLRGGRLVFTSSSIGADTLALHGSGISWRPGIAGGETASASAGAAGSVPYSSPASLIEVSKGDGDAATLTVGSLVREGTGVLTIDTGAGDLGNTEKVKIQGTVPSSVNGVLPPYLLGRDLTTGDDAIRFLSYSQEDGFVPATMVDNFADAAEASIVRVTNATVVAESKRVQGVVVDDRAAFTIQEGVTLTIGDGTNPAGVVFNAQSGSTTDHFTGSGTIDFGSSEGYVWHSTPAKDRALEVKTKIKGSNGIVFAAQPSGTCPFFRLYGAYRDWTGPTHFIGCRAWMQDAKALGTNGSPVWVHGDKRIGSAQIMFPNEQSAFHQAFYLSGFGCQKDDRKGALYTTGNAVTLNGPVTLVDDTALFLGNHYSGFLFNGGVSGPGGLICSGQTSESEGLTGTVFFNVTNTYAGATEVNDNVRIVVNPCGTLGQGPLTFHKGRLLFNGQAGYLVTNAIFGAAVTTFTTSVVTFASSVELASASLSQSSVGILTNATFGLLDSDSISDVHAVSNTVSLSIGGADGEVYILGDLSDGSGRMNLVKEGTNTTTLVGSKTFTGSVSVKAGSLRLVENLLHASSCVWHLDASRPETVLRDEYGIVTNWVSVKGAPMNFTQTHGYPTPSYVENALNGMPAVYFNKGNSNRLAAASAATQRTVFIVNVPRNIGWWKMEGIFGIDWVDAGVRIYKNSQWQKDVTGSMYNMTGKIIVNGVAGDGNFSMDRPQVLTLEHSYDNGKSVSTFRPAIGGYCPESENAGGERNFNGYLAEVIAFDRILFPRERMQVENYLAQKWGIAPAGFHEDVPALNEVSVLQPDTVMTLQDGASVDLCGHNQTLSSLFGEGRIVNSMTNPVVLTVTGACDFHGQIEGNTILKKTGSVASELSLVAGPGTTLQLDGGTASVGIYNSRPPQNGLLYWLDASKRETIMEDAGTGRVTNWTSRAGSVSRFYWDQASVDRAYQQKWNVGAPTYSATAMQGKPAVCFSGAQGLRSSDVACAKTIVILAMQTASQANMAGLWGMYPSESQKSDIGFRYENGIAIGNYSKIGNLVRVNGNTTTELKVAVPSSAPFCFCARAESWQNRDYTGSFSNRTGYNTLNDYYSTRGGNQVFAEVLAYDRELSLEELVSAEAYLFQKWMSSGIVSPENVKIFDDDTSVVLSGGASLTVNGGAVTMPALSGDGTVKADSVTLTGTVTVTVQPDGTVSPVVVDGDLVLDGATLVLIHPENLTKGKQMLFRATGSVNGEFSAVYPDPTGSQSVTRSGNNWYLIWSSGTIITIR